MYECSVSTASFYVSKFVHIYICFFPQAHTAVRRAVEFLQDLTGLKFPPADTVLHAYLHFEALTDHEYKYSFITCGDHPPVVIMNLHKKGVFHLSGMTIVILYLLIVFTLTFMY